MTLLHKFLGDVEIFDRDVRVIKGNTNVTLITSEFYKMMEDAYSVIIEMMNYELKYDNDLRENKDQYYLHNNNRYTDYDKILSNTPRYRSFRNRVPAEQKRYQLEWSLVISIIDALVTYELSLRKNT